MHAYNDTNDDVVHTYGRVHGNGEQTHVHIVSVGDSSYAAIAFDVDPANFEPIAAECVAFDPTLEGAAQRARRWMEQTPKGVAYQDGDAEQGSDTNRRILGFLKRAVVKLNEMGNRQREQMQNQQGGGKQ